MLDQRRRRWADVVQMLYKCFVLAGWVTDTDTQDVLSVNGIQDYFFD